MSKRMRATKYERVRTGGARTQQGLPDDIKAQLTYWTAYIEFLDMMCEDPRFLWLEKELELWEDA